GCVEMDRYVIHVGTEHRGKAADVFIDETTSTVFIDGVLVGHIGLDPGRRYQASGRGQPRTDLV
ncbi:MAG TPA: hypothetical protein VI916_05410, partial [Acidimicrobiia bacterium]|nr:hypothetical protein [Acidimicrobiia bacterium]